MVLVRMVGNAAVDMAIGAIPVLGDLFDFGWKANSRNLALIERYVTRPEATHQSSALIVGATLAGLGLLAVGSIYLAFSAIRGIISML